jgi:enoyl-CoA hydratase
MTSEPASALAFSHVEVGVADGVATVALSSPPVNALSRELSDQLTDALDRISELAEIRAVVLTGRGHVFCAGADLKNRDRYLAGPGDFAAHSRRARECFHAVRECAKPVVAAVNGPALGAGLAIVASADIIVAAEEASLGLPEVKVGLLGGCSHALRLFGHSRTRRMALTGYRVSGAELYRLGVAEECTPAEALLPTALAIAAEIAESSPVAVQTMKRTLNTVEELSLRDGYRFEQDMTGILRQSPDSQEAQRAFLEKRPPRFGRDQD